MVITANYSLTSCSHISNYNGDFFFFSNEESTSDDNTRDKGHV